MNIKQFRIDYIKRRKESGLSQKDVSSIFGVEQASLSRFEKGTQTLSLSAAFKLWDFVYPREKFSLP